MPKLRQFSALVVTTCLLAILLQPAILNAQITDCDVTLSPSQVNPGSTQDYTFSLINGSAARIRWVQITRPNSNFTLNGGTLSGWTIVPSSDNVTFSGGVINTGASRNFVLNSVTAANVNAPSANWTIQAADNNSGTSPYTCTGTFGTQIGTPDTTPPVISSISVTSITTSSATITWSTNKLSTSVVRYGTTASYGAAVSDSTLVSTHSLNLTGLQSSTGYHFQVQSTDASSNTASSSDNTFLTPTLTPTLNSTVPVSSSTTTTTQTPVKTVTKTSGDTTAPTVIISTDLSKPFKTPPLISGTASDNVAVASIDYSIDGGENWLPVDTTAGLGQKQASFSFQSANLPDGNYSVLVRATDSSGNVGVSTIATLIIDFEPPILSPAVYSVGPQLLDPVDNKITAVKGVDLKITLFAQGGPTQIQVRAVSAHDTRLFSLTKTKKEDFWSGILAFDKEGTYQLIARGVDGAKNVTERTLNTVTVIASPKIVDQTGVAISRVKVSVFTFSNETSSWLLWDAAAYGENNPQLTNFKGEFNYYLPSGQYYLKVEKTGFSSQTSNIFQIKTPVGLVSSVTLNESLSLTIGGWKLSVPDFSFKTFSVQPVKVTVNNSFEEKNLPSFALESTGGQKLNSVDLLGKLTVLTFISTWAPQTEDQIQSLEALNGSGFNLIPIATLDSLEKIKAYKEIGGYNLNFLADPQSSFANQMGIYSLPTHIFVSRSGVISAIRTGFLTKEELQSELSKL